MCGIAGFIGYESIENYCRKANHIQLHRGPDHQGLWSVGDVGFAHQRLSIIDLSESGNQPFVKKNHVIVYNGEVYNYRALAREHLPGVEFFSNTDTEVVLELFLKYGKDAVSLLRGMFAFAIWDINKEELFLARDHFGIKPLFYHLDQSRLAFASELKTLLGTVVSKPIVNLSVLVKALNYTWVPGDDSIVQGVLKLPPGHLASYKKSTHQIAVEKYHNNEVLDLPFTPEELSKVVVDSVKNHLVADVPVSSFLSGGLDSSLISKIAKDELGSLNTYTIARAEEDSKVERMSRDEDYARELARAEGFNHKEFLLGADIMKYLPKMVYHLDEPIGDPAAINTYLMCYYARQKGVKVILSGMGADELFFGYRRHKAYMIARAYDSVPNAIRKCIEYGVRILPVRAGRIGLKHVRWAKKFLSFADKSPSERYRLSYSYYSEEELLELFQSDVSDEISNLIKEHDSLFNSVSSSEYNMICNTDVNYFMTGLNLTYTDRSSMAASVEVRVPFIDKVVVKQALRVDGRLKYSNNVLKNILKQSAEKLLPKKIIYRPKASFGAPIRSWISNDLKFLIDDLLSPESIQSRGIFDGSKIKAMLDADREGKKDYAYQLYQLLTIELWFRIFIDKREEYLHDIKLTPLETK